MELKPCYVLLKKLEYKSFLNVEYKALGIVATPTKCASTKDGSGPIVKKRGRPRSKLTSKNIDSTVDNVANQSKTKNKFPSVPTASLIGASSVKEKKQPISKGRPKPQASTGDLLTNEKARVKKTRGRPKSRRDKVPALPQDVLTQDLLPQDLLSQDILSQDILPQELLPENMLPPDLLLQELLPLVSSDTTPSKLNSSVNCVSPEDFPSPAYSDISAESASEEKSPIKRKRKLSLKTIKKLCLTSEQPVVITRNQSGEDTTVVVAKDLQFNAAVPTSIRSPTRVLDDSTVYVQKAKFQQSARVLQSIDATIEEVVTGSSVSTSGHSGTCTVFAKNSIDIIDSPVPDLPPSARSTSSKNTTAYHQRLPTACYKFNKRGLQRHCWSKVSKPKMKVISRPVPEPQVPVEHQLETISAPSSSKLPLDLQSGTAPSRESDDKRHPNGIDGEGRVGPKTESRVDVHSGISRASDSKNMPASAINKTEIVKKKNTALVPDETEALCRASNGGEAANEKKSDVDGELLKKGRRLKSSPLKVNVAKWNTFEGFHTPREEDTHLAIPSTTILQEESGKKMDQVEATVGKTKLPESSELTEGGAEGKPAVVDGNEGKLLSVEDKSGNCLIVDSKVKKLASKDEKPAARLQVPTIVENEVGMSMIVNNEPAIKVWKPSIKVWNNSMRKVKKLSSKGGKPLINVEKSLSKVGKPVIVGDEVEKLAIVKGKVGRPAIKIILKPTIVKDKVEKPITVKIGKPSIVTGEVGKPAIVKSEVLVGNPASVKGEVLVGKPASVQGEVLVGKPASVQGEVGKPAIVKGEVGKPAIVKGEVGKPAIVKGEVGKPASVKGEVGKPASVKGEVPVGKPASVKGEVGKPASVKGEVLVGNPAIVKGEIPVGKPAIVKGEVGKPASVKGEIPVGKPAIVKGEVPVGNPAIVKGEVGKPASVKGEDGKPSSVKDEVPVGNPAIVKGEVGKPASVKGEVREPASVKGEVLVGKPAIVKGKVGKPAIVKGEVGKPASVKGEVPVGKPASVKGEVPVGNPAIVRGEVGKPASVKGEVGEPEIVKSKVDKPIIVILRRPAILVDQVKKPAIVEDKVEKPIIVNVGKPSIVKDKVKEPIIVNVGKPSVVKDKVEKPIVVMMIKPAIVGNKVEKPTIVGDKVEKPVIVKVGKPSNVKGEVGKPSIVEGEVKKAATVVNKDVKPVIIKDKVGKPPIGEEKERKPTVVTDMVGKIYEIVETDPEIPISSESTMGNPMFWEDRVGHPLSLEDEVRNSEILEDKVKKLVIPEVEIESADRLNDNEEKYESDSTDVSENNRNYSSHRYKSRDRYQPRRGSRDLYEDRHKYRETSRDRYQRRRDSTKYRRDSRDRYERRRDSRDRWERRRDSPHRYDRRRDSRDRYERRRGDRYKRRRESYSDEERMDHERNLRKRKIDPAELRGRPSPRTQHDQVDEPHFDKSVTLLSWYDSDLHLIIDPIHLASAQPMSKNAIFANNWAGVRATYGARVGRVAYQVCLTERLGGQPGGLRVGWSMLGTTLQLGEASCSYGYDSSGRFVNSGNSQLECVPPFKVGDVVTALLDMDSDPITMAFCLNGVPLDCGMSVQRTDLPQGAALFPHVLSKCVAFGCNFGSRAAPWCPVPAGYTLMDQVPLVYRAAGPKRPESRTDCEFVALLGSPDCDKTDWALRLMSEYPEKHYYMTGNGAVIHRFKDGWLPDAADPKREKIITAATSALLKTAWSRRRNYIHNQNELSPSEQHKLAFKFASFMRTAVVLMPGDAVDKEDPPRAENVYLEVIYPQLEKEAVEALRRRTSQPVRPERRVKEERDTSSSEESSGRDEPRSKRCRSSGSSDYGYKRRKPRRRESRRDRPVSRLVESKGGENVDLPSLLSTPVRMPSKHALDAINRFN